MSSTTQPNELKPSDRTVVLLSSGLDSAVNLYGAARQARVELALTFDYGQRAAKKEIESSQNLCADLKINHQVVSLPFFANFSNSALLNREKALPMAGHVAIDDPEISKKTARAVWVPNRNGVFLNIAAAFAESLGAKYVIPGFNIEEAATFTDNTSAFLKALDHSFSFSTASTIRTYCFTASLNKTEIVRLGRDWGVPFEKLWPCYEAGEQICGQCESCQRFLRAMEVAQ